MTIKHQIRQKMRSLNLLQTSQQRDLVGQALCREIEELPIFASAHCIALFCSLPDEPSTDQMFQRWGAAKRLVLPRVEGTAMNLYDFEPKALSVGSFGILEPSAELTRSVPVLPFDVDLIVVPGVSFTWGGGRLGRGRGFYDRYLSQEGFGAYKIGVAYRHQILEELPLEDHDVRMDCVIAQ